MWWHKTKTWWVLGYITIPDTMLMVRKFRPNKTAIYELMKKMASGSSV